MTVSKLVPKVLSASQPVSMAATLIKLWEMNWKISNPVGNHYCLQIRIFLQNMITILAMKGN